MRRIFRNLKKKTGITVVLVILCVSIGALIFYDRFHQDRTPPNISFEKESVQLTEDEVTAVLKEDYTCLLNGVNAFDNEDGDLSDYLIVYSVNIYGDNSYAVVNYRVLDTSGNMAEEQRLAYLKSPEQIYNDLLTSASDEAAGMIHEWMEENSKDYDSDTEKPVLEMADTVNLNVGESFDPQQYLVKLEDNKDSSETLWQNCRVEGEFDLNSPGVYPLAFYVTDSDGNESDAAVLVLTVGMDETKD